MTTQSVSSAESRRRNCMSRLEIALNKMSQEGAVITIKAVARRAGVSRSWLYSDEEARHLVVAARDSSIRTGGQGSEGGHDGPSWKARAEMLRDENLRLRREVSELQSRLSATLLDER